ncbi:hypothetical protein EAF00_005057 [Botryotinia globosa]|nr:hypothetical protein EAF00_005057 [Botryotinia globosa]
MSLAYFMDIPPNRLTTRVPSPLPSTAHQILTSLQLTGVKYYSFGEDGHYYYLNPDGSQLYAHGSWKLFINTSGHRYWKPLQPEFACNPEKMNARFVYNFSHKLIYRETRDCLRDIAAPSLGTLIMRYNQEVVQEHLDKLGSRINSDIRRQHWERVKKAAWDELVYLEWKTGLWYGEWLEKERKRLQDKGQYSEYNVWVDDELKRVMKDNDVEDIKKESIEERAIKQDNVEIEAVKEEIIKEKPTEEVFIKDEFPRKVCIKTER